MNKKILIIGAGHSSGALIRYLASTGQEKNWQIMLADADLQKAEKKASAFPNVTARQLNIHDSEATHELVQPASIVISLLPSTLHHLIARVCLLYVKPLLTASYIDEKSKKLQNELCNSQLGFLYECGLDPGIDHMSAMQLLDEVKSEGGKITAFRSYVGGLMTPESVADNPWKYKFTWNPRNVVLAGQSTTGNSSIARYLKNNRVKYIPYHQLFHRLHTIDIPGHGTFEGYANRNSLDYIDVYGLQGADTVIRGTLRYPGFCKAWNILVQLGLTDNSYPLHRTDCPNYSEWLKAYLPDMGCQLRQCIARVQEIPYNDHALDCLEWLGLFSEEPIDRSNGTPAELLQDLLEKKWQTETGDQDMIVMKHMVDYELNGKSWCRESSLVHSGNLDEQSAMAQTVGLPLALAAEMMLEKPFERYGVIRPVYPEIYKPLLSKLAEQGIAFRKHTFELK